MKKLSITLTHNETIAGWIYYAFQLLVLGLLLTLANMALNYPLSLTQLNILCFVINFLITTVIFRKFLWKNIQIAIKNPGRTIGYMFCGFVLYYVASVVIGIIIVLLYPNFINANDSAIGDMLQESFWPMLLSTVILVPITEEILYRGLIFGRIYRRNPVLGYLSSMFVFALIHVVGYIGTYDPSMLAISVLQYLPAGFFLAWVYVQTDSIVSCTLMHMLINLIGTLAMR